MLPTRLRLTRGVLLLAVVAAASVAVPSAALAAQAPGRCASITTPAVEVIRLQSVLGCGSALRSAVVRAVREGFVGRDGYYCRWGQGGTRPIVVAGRTYFGGFCYRRGREASFLGRERTGARCKPVTVTDVNGDTLRISDLRVVQTTCAVAAGVARSFHGQIIGSSGAAVAAGYGCGYSSGGAVTCRSGADGTGSKRVAWKPIRFRTQDAAATATSARSATRSGAAAAPNYYSSGCGSVGYLDIRPEQVHPSCAGSCATMAKALVWSNWGQPIATADGVGLLNRAYNGCAGGPVDEFPARVTVSGPKLCKGTKGSGYVYRNVHVAVRVGDDEYWARKASAPGVVTAAWRVVGSCGYRRTLGEAHAFATGQMEQLQKRQFGYETPARAACRRRGAATFMCSVRAPQFTHLRGRIDLTISTCSIRSTFRATIPECLEAGCGRRSAITHPRQRFSGGFC